MITRNKEECVTPSDFMRYARESRGLTAAELGRRAGINSSTITNWECGYTQPTVYCALAVTDALGITIEEYVGHSSRTC